MDLQELQLLNLAGLLLQLLQVLLLHLLQVLLELELLPQVQASPRPKLP